MFRIKACQQFVSIVAIILLLWIGIIPGLGQIAAVQAATMTCELVLPATPSSSDWYEIDRRLANATRTAHDVAEDYATTELNRWVDA